MPENTFKAGPDASCPRTVYSIAWSCLATIFLCTWVCVHPNVPPTGSWAKRTARRLEVMLWAFIVPELILSWAISQWFGAKRVAREFRASKWTETHAFFLIMGGFHICTEGKTKVLTHSRLSLLSDEQISRIPKIVTSEEICDKSKSDFLAKAFAVLQVTWFIIQCVGRGVQKLALTELELLTLALASLNVIMFYFWWNKPMSVDTPILLHLGSCAWHDISSSSPDRDGRDSEEGRKPLSKDGMWTCLWQHVLDIHLASLPGIISNWIKDVVVQAASHIWESSGQLLVEECESCDIARSPRHVSQFHSLASSYQDTVTRLAIVGALGLMFGALHLVAWIFTFPSHTEWVLWQVSAVSITVCPFLYGCKMVLGISLDWDRHDGLMTIVSYVFYVLDIFLLLAYVVARLTLFIEALVLLRHIQSNVTADVNWAGFIPHIA